MKDAATSGKENSPELDANEFRVLAPWERTFERIATPLEHFIHQETAGGLLLFACTVLALVAANSSLAGLYSHFIELPFTIGLGSWSISKSLHHWVNDGLMTLFFFVVGLEIKREMLVGELADLRQAALPVIAAGAGMAAPALIYLGLLPDGIAVRGWGIPMATDIAFALGALVLLGARIPRSMLTFLLALAIVDDLGALIVIALFYTETLNVALLLLALAWISVLILFNRSGIRRPWAYFVVGLLLWATLLQSGIHATLAGVVTAFTIPALPRYDPARFAEQFDALLLRYRSRFTPEESILRNQALRSILQTMENAVLGVMSPLQRLEYKLHTPVAILIMPLFALVNAGIPLDPETLADMIRHPVTQAVMAGLLVGKPLGITLAIWCALRVGLVRLPRDMTMRHVTGIGLLAGIGFTMSIFISQLAFNDSPDLMIAAKSGIVYASFAAGLAGLLWLRLMQPAPGLRADLG